MADQSVVRSVRNVQRGSADKIIPDDQVTKELIDLFSNFTDNGSNPHSESLVRELYKQQHGDRSTAERNIALMFDFLGFSVIRAPSKIFTGGRGVIVNKGAVPKGSVVAIYPGAVYADFEPVLLQSIRNPFIFRCIDRILVDGNDKGISRFIYKSCCQRDRVGPFFTADMSWLTENPANPLAIGQYINNHNKEYPANVAYQEIDVPSTFPFDLRRYIPNVHYSASLDQTPDHCARLMRTVVLVATRDIDEGEELFSSYFTVVH